MKKNKLLTLTILTGLILNFAAINSCDDLPFRDQLVDSLKKWGQQAKLTAGEDAEANSQYGYAVAISGDFAVVGVYLQNVGALTDAGAVYIYKRNGTSWDLFQTLTGTRTNDYFGIAVDISGNFLIVGAPGQTEEVAYIYENTGTQFVERKKLHTGGVSGPSYGSSVAIDGDWAVVGAPYTDWVGLAEGAAYVYYKNTDWAEHQQLKPLIQHDNECFGFRVDISGAIIAISAPYNDNLGIDTGAVYIYEKEGTTWGKDFDNHENKMITVAGGQPYDIFGYTINLSQDYLITGATGNNGFVMVFKKSGIDWVPYNRLSNVNILPTDKLGYSVAITEQFAIMGTQDSDEITSNEGALYIFKFEKEQWEFFSKHTADDAAADDRFGSALAVSGDYIITGTLGCTVNNKDNAGAAYIFYRQ